MPLGCFSLVSVGSGLLAILDNAVQDSHVSRCSLDNCPVGPPDQDEVLNNACHLTRTARRDPRWSEFDEVADPWFVLGFAPAGCSRLARCLA